MTHWRRSLRLRLLAGTLAWVILSLAAAGWGLRALFLDHITQQFQTQLVMQLDRLSAAVDWEPGDHVSVAPMVSDARLEEPLSGLYWQVDRVAADTEAVAARSRSLWDQALTLPPAPAQYAARGYRVLHLVGPKDQALLAVARVVQLPDAGAPALRLVVAGDQAFLAEPLASFTRLLLLALLILGAGLAAAVVLQLQLALRPLQTLRARLAAVRRGAATELAGDFPQEVQPLVDEFNRTLAENADIVQRARAQAGNLAHAVHTPLTILANAAGSEATPLARLVQEQVASASRQVDYHLARARAAAAVRSTGLNTPVLPPLRALLRTMARLHAERGLRFALAPNAADAAFRGEEQDLYELLGNLLDNAGKWARAQVRTDVQRDGDTLVCTVDDDGPGIPARQRERMFGRGVRLDERRPGTGLGLDIVRTLAETYGGSVAADASPLGGLRITLRLPAAECAAS